MKLDLLEHENILFNSAASPYQVEDALSSSRLTSRLSQSLGWCTLLRNHLICWSSTHQYTELTYWSMRIKPGFPRFGANLEAVQAVVVEKDYCATRSWSMRMISRPSLQKSLRCSKSRRRVSVSNRRRNPICLWGSICFHGGVFGWWMTRWQQLLTWMCNDPIFDCYWTKRALS